MILDFTISNFRSIRDPQTISFEATKDTHLEDYYVVKKGNYRILKMAVILGANASGKSNVVRAFDLFPKLMLYPCENKTSKIEYDKFALDKESAKTDSVMIVNFLCGEQKYRYEVHFNNEFVTWESLQRHPFGELRQHKVYERVTDIKSGLSTIKWGDKFRSNVNTRALNVNLLHNRTVFGAYQSSNVDIPWMKEIEEWLKGYMFQYPNPMTSISPLSDILLKEYVSDMFANNYLDKNIMASLLQKVDIGISDFIIEKETIDYSYFAASMMNDVVLSTNETKAIRQYFHQSNMPQSEHNKIRFIHKGKDCLVPFDWEIESGGTRRYFELAGYLLVLEMSSHFLVIDELECRLHPDLYTHFITTFLHNAKESQIVFTTHSREFLADKDMFRDDIVWFTEKNDEGATELYSLADFGSDVLRDSSNRYNFYRAGRLGAVPRLGDTYIANPKKN
ncbi:MAG: ATP-binding protein [Bacteroidales bacterium]|nr:ATP-binding protein [Bacteroidales bacterium]